ncbi:cytochrome c biogenesis protein CcdA [Pseudoalteromonas sp. T1lg23B]|uniref:cytochrome c biogenesis protein CcdA n=1 Tax=Pseudoalteromonas sp. T1lg23B TaxID=2077097 RepID=UPI0022778276|nr:cytochrome c biogenesis protein CcdA [Pseudoalteromonas sp. T1lg23B]
MGWIKLPHLGVSLTPNLKSKHLNVFVSGALSGLVMAPCTSPILGMLLMYVAAQGDAVLGSVSMFLFALGMSILLILAGSLSGFINLLPRSGPWLRISNIVMASAMVGVSIYFILQVL